MLKQISSLGRALGRAEQKEVNGSGLKPNPCCNPALHCCAPCPGEVPGCYFVYSSPPACV